MSQIRSANTERRPFNPYGRYAKKPGVVTILKDKMATWWNWMFHRTNHEYIIQRSESYQQSIIVPVNYQIEKAQIVEKDHVQIRQNRNKRIIPISEFLAEEESQQVEIPKKKLKNKQQKNHFDLIKKRKLNDPVQKMEVQVVKVDIGNIDNDQTKKNNVLLDQITPNKQPEPTNQLASNLIQQMKQEKKVLNHEQIKEVLQKGLMKRVSSNLQDLQADVSNTDNSNRNSPQQLRDSDKKNVSEDIPQTKQTENIVQTEIQTPPVELKPVVEVKPVIEVKPLTPLVEVKPVIEVKPILQLSITQVQPPIIEPQQSKVQPPIIEAQQPKVEEEKKVVLLDSSTSLFSSNFASKYPKIAKDPLQSKVTQKPDPEIKPVEQKQSLFSFNLKPEAKDNKPLFSLQTNKDSQSLFSLPTQTNISFADALKSQQQVLKLADQKPQLENLKTTLHKMEDSIKVIDPIKQSEPLQQQEVQHKECITIPSPSNQSPIKQQGSQIEDQTAKKPLFEFLIPKKQEIFQSAVITENQAATTQSNDVSEKQTEIQVKPIPSLFSQPIQQTETQPKLFSFLDQKKPEISVQKSENKVPLFSFLQQPKQTDPQPLVEIQKITIIETKPLQENTKEQQPNLFKDLFKSPLPTVNLDKQQIITPQFQMPLTKPSLDTPNENKPIIENKFKQDQNAVQKPNIETPVATKSILFSNLFQQDPNQKQVNLPQQGTNGSEKDSQYTFGQQVNNTLASDAAPKLDKLDEQQQNNPFLTSPSKDNQQVKVYWNNIGIAGDLNFDKSSTPPNNLSQELFKQPTSNIFQRDTSQFQLSSGQSSNKQFSTSHSQPQISASQSFFPLQQQTPQPIQQQYFGGQNQISQFQPMQQQYVPQTSMQDCMEEDGMQQPNFSQFQQYQGYQPQQQQQSYQYYPQNDIYQNQSMPQLQSTFSNQFFPNPQSIQQAQSIFNINGNPPQQQQQIQSLFSETPQQMNRQSSQNNSSFMSNGKGKGNKKQRISGNNE